MCKRCTTDLRAKELPFLEVLQEEPDVCEALRRVIATEIAWRRAGEGTDDPRDE